MNHLARAAAGLAFWAIYLVAVAFAAVYAAVGRPKRGALCWCARTLLAVEEALWAVTCA